MLDGWWRIEWTDGLIDRLGEIKTIVCQFSFIHWIRVCHACSRTTVNCRLPAKLAAMRSSAVFTERLSWMWSGGLFDHSCECHHYVPSGSLSLPPSLSCSASALVRMFRRQRLGPSLLLFTYHAQKKKENIKNFSAHQDPGQLPLWRRSLSSSFSALRRRSSPTETNAASLYRGPAALICRPPAKYVQVPSDIRLLQSRLFL